MLQTAELLFEIKYINRHEIYVMAHKASVCKNMQILLGITSIECPEAAIFPGYFSLKNNVKLNIQCDSMIGVPLLISRAFVPRLSEYFYIVLLYLMLLKGSGM